MLKQHQSGKAGRGPRPHAEEEHPSKDKSHAGHGEGTHQDMRALFRQFKGEQTQDAENDSAVAAAANEAEIEALNKTLDNMELTVSVRKKEGASSQNITEDYKITKL